MHAFLRICALLLLSGTSFAQDFIPPKVYGLQSTVLQEVRTHTKGFTFKRKNDV